jgi:hypothetical protein
MFNYTLMCNFANCYLGAFNFKDEQGKIGVLNYASRATAD